MEFFTWTFLLETVVGGFIGNRADAGIVKVWSVGWKRALQNLNAPDLQSTRNELAMAVSRSFLWAQQSLVQECLDEFTGGTYGAVGGHTILSGHETEVPWLIAKDKQLKADLKALEKGKLGTLAEADMPELEGLLQTQDAAGALNGQLMAALAQEDAPNSYRIRAIATGTGLLARLAAFFEFELKTNQTVQNWFQTELLLRVNAQLQTAQPLFIEDLKQGLRNLASQLPQVLNRLDNLAIAVNELGQNVTEVRALVMARADELVALVLRNADDLVEVKRLLGEVLIALRQRMVPSAATTSVLPAAAPREGPNPFIYGPAVPPERFFGRRRAKADIKNRIGGVEPQSINIVGLRRNGKSSMLRYVKERIGEFCAPEQKPLVVLLDLQDRRFHTPEGIVEGLRRGIKKQTGSEPWSRDANNDPFELEDGLESLQEKGYRLIVMFDEFGAMGKRLELFQDWGDDWRAKASASLVTLVIASRRPLSEVYSTLNLTSPFGNLFSTTILGLLEREPWQQLLDQGKLVKEEVDWVEQIVGRLPYYTQLAAAMFWQHGTFEHVHQGLRQEAERRFKELWADLTFSEQTVLKQIAKNDSPLGEISIVESLRFCGLLKTDSQLCGDQFNYFVSQQ